jgi:hypothetical protein
VKEPRCCKQYWRLKLKIAIFQTYSLLFYFWRFIISLPQIQTALYCTYRLDCESALDKQALHRFFPLLWITVLKFGTLYAEIEIRKVGLTMAIHSNSVRKVHPVGTEASVSKPARLQSRTHFCPTCKECGLGKTMCTIPRLCDCKGGPTFEHLQSFLIY